MKNLAIVIIGIALLWGLSGCADHQSYYSGYYTSGYPYSSLRTGAIYSSYPGYPGYRPYYSSPVYRTWVGPTSYHYPSGYGTWPAYFAPYPFYSVSFGYFKGDFYDNDHGRYFRDYYNKSGHNFSPYRPRKHLDKHHSSKSRHDRSKYHYVRGDDHKGHRDYTGHAPIARHRQDKVLLRTGNPARLPPVVKHESPDRNHGVTIEYRQPSRSRTPLFNRQTGRLSNLNNPVRLVPAVRNESSHGDKGVKVEYHRRSHDRTPHFDRRTNRLPQMNNPVTRPSSLSRSFDKVHQTTVRDGSRSTERFHRIQRDPRGERSVKRSRGLQNGKRPGGTRSFCMGGQC